MIINGEILKEMIKARLSIMGYGHVADDFVFRIQSQYSSGRYIVVDDIDDIITVMDIQLVIPTDSYDIQFGVCDRSGMYIYERNTWTVLQKGFDVGAGRYLDIDELINEMKIKQSLKGFLYG